MCRSSLHGLIQALPKCEHHLHIEGSLQPATLFSLSRRNGIPLPVDDPAYASEDTLLERYKHFASLDDFLHYYYIGMSVLIHAKDFEDLAWAYFQRAQADGVLHAEVFFDPQAHVGRGIAFNVVMDGLQAARSRAERDLSLTSELICCFLRHEPSSSALSLFEQEDVQRYFHQGTICGIGLDSSETPFPPELFASLYDKARSRGLKMTAHAGEEGPAKNIATSLDLLGCHRIDHGVRLAEDAQLLSEVASKGTLLTVCPLSNVNLQCFARLEQVPIRKFLDAGVNFSINSDDPAYLGGFILENYCAVQEAFALTVEEWTRICTAAINGSWCSETRKTELLQILGEVLKKHS